MRRCTAFFTLGYQRHTPTTLLRILSANDIHYLIDVRQNPVSRKRGFSKRFLEAGTSRLGIEYLVPAPGDSISKRFSFQRGVRGLQRFLNQMWPKRRYYLGEWHFHPDGFAFPSGADANQMRDVACAESYHCPEAVLVIVGGNPSERFTLESYVFLRGTTNAVALQLEPTSREGTPE